MTPSRFLRPILFASPLRRMSKVLPLLVASLSQRSISSGLTAAHVFLDLVFTEA